MRLEVLVGLPSKRLAMQLVRCQQPVRDADGMHRRAGMDGLWLRTVRDGAVIPSGCSAFVHRQPPSGRHGLLPTPIKCVFDHSKFPTMPRRIRWRLNLAVGERVRPNISVLLVPIVCKMHAPMHVGESTARHALFCRSDGIECLAGVPAVVDRRQPLYRSHKLTAEEARDAMFKYIERVGKVARRQVERREASEAAAIAIL